MCHSPERSTLLRASVYTSVASYRPKESAQCPTRCVLDGFFERFGAPSSVRVRVKVANERQVAGKAGFKKPFLFNPSAAGNQELKDINFLRVVEATAEQLDLAGRKRVPTRDEVLGRA